VKWTVKFAEFAVRLVYVAWLWLETLLLLKANSWLFCSAKPGLMDHREAADIGRICDTVANGTRPRQSMGQIKRMHILG
jgi:hypothetical protein